MSISHGQTYVFMPISAWKEENLLTKIKFLEAWP